MYKVVFLRHGQSTWNQENKFTGWVDVDIDDEGMRQAQRAGQLLLKAGFNFDVSYTSFLKRAIRTLWIVLDEMNLMWIPEYKSWRLNERHYGALQGLSKSMTASQYSEEQVKLWRRCYSMQPPALAADDPNNPSNDRRYQTGDDCTMPVTESLEDTLNRLLPYWQQTICPAIVDNKQVLVVAHGNTIRALMKHLDAIGDKEIEELNVPIGQPLVYELDDTLKPIRHYYLDTPESIAAGVEQQIKMGQADTSGFGL